MIRLPPNVLICYEGIQELYIIGEIQELYIIGENDHTSALSMNVGANFAIFIKIFNKTVRGVCARPIIKFEVARVTETCASTRTYAIMATFNNRNFSS